MRMDDTAKSYVCLVDWLVQSGGDSTWAVLVEANNNNDSL